MEWSSILVALAIGISAFAVTWATARHFTGLAHEHGAALAIAVAVGLIVAISYAVLESRLFDVWRRRNKHR